MRDSAGISPDFARPADVHDEVVDRAPQRSRPGMVADVKRLMLAVVTAAAVAAAVAAVRRDRSPATPPGSWQPVDHRPNGTG